MTPERKKYLDGISYEERVIRQHIVGLKSTITILKTLCKEDRFACVLQKDKQEISKFKILIKALKKQLPALKKHYTDEVCDYIGCPICHFEIDKDYPCYCNECGQKLR